MSMYQFLTAVRPGAANYLTDANGAPTSHLAGMFYRTIKLVEHGINPVYVFDGKPPMLKSGELTKRFEQRQKVQDAIEELKQKAGTDEEIRKLERQTIRVSKEQNEEAKKLLRLMGIPVVCAPGEAEAQCAALVRAGVVDAAASEDMDTLTFGTPVLWRHLAAGESKRVPVTALDSKVILDSLGLSQDEFIDMCILIGCDYVESIKGIGPKTAYSLINKHKNIETVLKTLSEKKSRYVIPQDWPYAAARKLFKSPDVLDPMHVELNWGPPNVPGLVEFLVGEKGFSGQKVRKGAEKLIEKEQKRVKSSK